MFESNTSLFDPQHGRIYIGKFRRRYYIRTVTSNVCRVVISPGSILIESREIKKKSVCVAIASFKHLKESVQFHRTISMIRDVTLDYSHIE